MRQSITICCALNLFILALYTAANAADTAAATVNLPTIDGIVAQLVKFVTGPVAILAAVITIITGAIMWNDRGGTTNAGFTAIGVMAIILGLLLGAGIMFSRLPGLIGAAIS